MEGGKIDALKIIIKIISKNINIYIKHPLNS